MSALAGFLVVRAAASGGLGKSGSPGLRYQGVDRVPPHPTDDENELFAISQYVFGDYKDPESNLVPSLEAAVRLLRLFSSSRHKYELLFCSKDFTAAQVIEQNGAEIERLGFDVAGIRGDYWSIVREISASDWASSFRISLNEFGLFARSEDAQAYLREYCDRGEPDSDSRFDVVYVVRVVLDENQPGGAMAN